MRYYSKAIRNVNIQQDAIIVGQGLAASGGRAVARKARRRTKGTSWVAACGRVGMRDTDNGQPPFSRSPNSAEKPVEIVCFDNMYGKFGH